MAQLTVTHFTGADHGDWRILDIAAVYGDTLPPAACLAIDDGTTALPAAWRLQGTSSHARYTTVVERDRLQAKQANLGRPGARHAALIPIRKTAEWWMMAQDERRAVYERSAHLPIGLDYLPAVARRLYHSRDLAEPFDFLTWFEFAADDEMRFNDMLVRLRASEEWHYVEREVDIRLERMH